MNPVNRPQPASMAQVERVVLSAVRQTIRRFGMMRGVRKAVIAFSAGPDSVCLLDVLHRLYRQRVRFILVYVNHGFRSERVLKREEALVRRYARRYGADFAIVRIRVPKTKLGPEGQARLRRHHALRDEMDRLAAQCIILGHNRDDLGETFVMNLIRGSGSRGCSSFHAVQPPFIRPLQSIEKNTVLEYLKIRGLPYASDATNEDTRFRRNLVRHKVMPLLRQINPRVLETLERTAGIIQQDDECLSSQAERIFRKTARLAPGRVSLDIAKVIRYNNALVSRVVMHALKVRAGCLEGIERKHIMSVIGLMGKGHGAVVHLPMGMYARRDYGTLVIGTRALNRDFYARLPMDGECRLPGGYLVRSRVLKSDFRIHCQPGIEIFDRAGLHPPLVIRKRRPGDHLVTRQGRKKLKKFCTEYRIPFDRRPDLLVLADRKGVLCLLGYGRASRALITDKTARAVAVTYEKTDQ